MLNRAKILYKKSEEVREQQILEERSIVTFEDLHQLSLEVEKNIILLSQMIKPT